MHQMQVVSFPEAGGRNGHAPASPMVALIERIEKLQHICRVHGWCVDLRNNTAPSELTLKLKGKVVGRSRKCVPRHALSRLGLPNTAYGFAIDVQGAIPNPNELVLFTGAGVEIKMLVPSQLQALSAGSAGNLEVVTALGLSGWAASVKPGTFAAVDVQIDGHDFARLPADDSRADLLEAGLRGGGFILKWGVSPTDKPEFEVAVRHATSGAHLPGSPVTIRDVSLSDYTIKPVDISDCSVTIIVPIYNAPDSLDRCLKSLVRNTAAFANLVLVDDASSDPRISRILDAYKGRNRIQIVRHARNLGFTQTINEAIRRAETDVIILNSDTEVGPRWLENLLVASRQGEKIGTVTALSNNAGAFSAPELGDDNNLPTELSREDAARLVMHTAMPIYPRVGTGNGFCMLIRRACFDDVGGFDAERFQQGYGEENDFCVRASRKGWTHLIDDRTYVFHNRSASFGDRAPKLKEKARELLAQYPEYDRITRDFSRRTDLNTVRFRIRRAFKELSEPVRPRALFVISTRTGGTPQTNNDLMNEASARFQPILLVSDGQVLQLIEPLRSGERVLARHVLRSAIDPVLHTSEEYTEVVKDWLLKYAIEIVHIRHLAWHSLDLAKDCKKLGIPVVFSFHDYYMICPSVKLLDERMVSCEGVCTASKGSCKSELWRPSSMPHLKHQYKDVWRQRSASCLAECDAFVTTSNAAKDIILRAFPEIADRLQVIPHGRTFDKFLQTAALPQRKEPFRIMVAGNISKAKGSALVAAAAAQLRNEGVEFYLLGNADDGLVGDDVVRLGPYQRDAFGEYMMKIKPSIGLLPSLWPETYCHVLTEFWATGIPVLGYDCGAVGERIRAQGGGWLFDEASADVLTYAIRSIRSDSNDLRDRIREVLEWQAGPGSSWTAREMGTTYSNLYSSLIDGRRIFA